MPWRIPLNCMGSWGWLFCIVHNWQFSCLQFCGNMEMAAKAFTGHIKLLIQMKHLITTQIMLVEAANAPPYGWMAAKHMESGHGIFSLEDKDLMKSLREAEMVVWRDTREIKACRGNSSNWGRGRGVRKPWWDNSNKTLEHIDRICGNGPTNIWKVLHRVCSTSTISQGKYRVL